MQHHPKDQVMKWLSARRSSSRRALKELEDEVGRFRRRCRRPCRRRCRRAAAVEEEDRVTGRPPAAGRTRSASIKEVAPSRPGLKEAKTSRARPSHVQGGVNKAEAEKSRRSSSPGASGAK